MTAEAASDYRTSRTPRVLLHVGVPKTATTAIQTCLAASRADLETYGVLYPGRRNDHNRAIRTVIDELDGQESDVSAWQRTTRAVRRHDGRACVSSELGAVASPRAAQRIVHDLGGDVDVVITLRPLERLLPSAWQEDLKFGFTSAFEPWLDDVIRGPRPANGDPNRFWYAHDHLTVAHNWLTAITPDRLHLVAVDPARPTDVFETFSRLLGLPAGLLTPDRSTRSNRSLSLAEAEVVRVLAVRSRETDQAGAVSSRALLAAQSYMSENRRPTDHEPRIVVPARYVHSIRAESRRIVDGLAAIGANVVGDLESLCPVTTPDDVEIPVVDSIPVDAAVLLLEGLSLVGRRADAQRADPPPPS